MSLTREHIIESALQVLRTYGLGDLTMRRLARELGVQPGALYWHIKNKQELLLALAREILTLHPTASGATAGERVRENALNIRTALLQIRDGADVVAVAYALDPTSLQAAKMFRSGLIDQQFSATHASWGADTLMHYILGSVSKEQTHTDLVRAGLLDGASQDQFGEAFIFGLDAILGGLGLASTQQE